MFLPKASPPPHTPPQGKSRGPSSQIHGADKSVSESDTSRQRKKEKRTNFLDFSLCKRKRDFLLLTKGKAPLTFFFFLCTVATARLGGARSAAFLLPLPATNEASQPRSGQTFSLSGSSPRGAGEWFPPRNAAPPGPGPGEAWVSAEDNFLVSALTSTHPAAGAEAGSGARRGRLRGRGQAGGGSSGAHFLRHISDI